MQRMPSSLRSKIQSGSREALVGEHRLHRARRWWGRRWHQPAVCRNPSISSRSRRRGSARGSSADQTAPIARKTSSASTSARSVPASTPAASSRAIAPTDLPARLGEQVRAAGDDRLQRAAHPALGRRVVDEAVHPLGERHVGRVAREQLVGRGRRGARPRCGRRPRPARRGWGSGGRASRCPTPARLATASSDTSVPCSANSSAPRRSSFSRLRRASARMLWVGVVSSSM